MILKKERSLVICKNRFRLGEMLISANFFDIFFESINSNNNLQ
jgi:hypothetical protein